MTDSPEPRLSSLTRHCRRCGERRPPGRDVRCARCGALVGVPYEAVVVAQMASGIAVLVWSLVQGRGREEAIALSMLEAGIVTALALLLSYRVGGLARPGAVPYRTAFAFAALLVAALCVPAYAYVVGDAELPAPAVFAVAVVGMPLLIGGLAAIPISRGRHLVDLGHRCPRCGVQASPLTQFCTACGAPMPPA